jgi:hypothetical protein
MFSGLFMQAAKIQLHYLDTHVPENDQEWAVFDNQVGARKKTPCQNESLTRIGATFEHLVLK